MQNWKGFNKVRKQIYTTDYKWWCDQNKVFPWDRQNVGRLCLRTPDVESQKRLDRNKAQITLTYGFPSSGAQSKMYKTTTLTNVHKMDIYDHLKVVDTQALVSCSHVTPIILNIFSLSDLTRSIIPICASEKWQLTLYLKN